MSVAFYRGQQLGPDDLNICLEASNGSPSNAAEIYYTLLDVTTGSEVLVGAPRRSPANPETGKYYASIIIPLDANIGLYRIRWSFREVIGGVVHQAVQEFEAIGRDAQPTSTMTTCVTDMVRRLRIMMRDNDPDRNYHFRPPAHEGTVNQFNQVFGYIWEDYELAEFLERSVDMISASPPATPLASCDALVRDYPSWRTLMLTGAASYALLALMVNWISEEFSYSIGGVSLDLEKSSKYESAANNYKDQFETQLEKAKSTVKIIRGVQQPKYGIGIRSAFGPYTGAGVLTPRKFLGI
jgi:hypothetical protein